LQVGGVLSLTFFFSLKPIMGLYRLLHLLEVALTDMLFDASALSYI
jgi:hypothetical protein